MDNLKFKGPRTGWCSQVVEHIKKKGECWQEIEEKRISVEIRD
jgi:hypothetical protein